MDRIEAMTVFLAAIETGSLSAAGRKLDMPLPTVSRKVSELESHLGARLLQRSTRRLTLTDAGRDYVDACKRILGDIDEAERAAAGEYLAPTGDLAISAPIVYGRVHLLPVLAEFLRAYPDVDVRLLLSDRAVNLFEEPIDLALRIGELPDSSLIATRVGSVHPVLCGSPEYFARRGRPLAPADLAAHDCVTFEGLVAPDSWSFGIKPKQHAVRVHSRLVVNTAEAAIQAATAGLGIARVLSYQVRDAVQRGELELALQAFEPAPWPVSLVFARQGRMPLKLRAFIDFAAPRLQALHQP